MAHAPFIYQCECEIKSGKGKYRRVEKMASQIKHCHLRFKELTHAPTIPYRWKIEIFKIH